MGSIGWSSALMAAAENRRTNANFHMIENLLGAGGRLPILLPSYHERGCSVLPNFWEGRSTHMVVVRAKALATTGWLLWYPTLPNFGEGWGTHMVVVRARGG